jgi:plastocyanin
MNVLNGINKIKQVGLGAMLMGVVSISLVACGGDTTTGAAPATIEPTATTAASTDPGTGGNTGSMTESTVKLSEWAVTLDKAEIPAGKVKFTVTNEGTFSHDYVIMEGSNVVGQTPSFTSAEGPKVLEVDLKPGSYTVICDIIGHPEKGMKNTLTVK